MGLSVCMCVHVVCVVHAHRLTHTHAQFRGLGIVIGMESSEEAENGQPYRGAIRASKMMGEI